MSLSLREKLLYHHIHPAKMSVDVVAAIAAAVLLWQQHLLRAIAVGIVLPLAASAIVLTFADLGKLTQSRLGVYAGRNMTPAMEAAKIVGVFLSWGGAWYRSVMVCILGLLVIALAWGRDAILARLQGGRRPQA
jgi:hypothetical protein